MMMMCLFGELLNRLRIDLGYWCEHCNEQCKRNGRSMAIEGKTPPLWYVGITFASGPSGQESRAPASLPVFA